MQPSPLPAPSPTIPPQPFPFDEKPESVPNAQLPKVQDALGYLEKVKQKFAREPHVYNQFLDIMKDFKSHAIDTEGVIARVKLLFRGNSELILGFNQFLPPGYKIEVSQLAPEDRGSARPKPTVEFNHAVQYVAKIKHRFRDQPLIYSDFLDILHDYQAKRTIDEVYQRVQKLFGDQPDLLEEFKYFLPGEAPTPAKQDKMKEKKAERMKTKHKEKRFDKGPPKFVKKREEKRTVSKTPEAPQLLKKHSKHISSGHEIRSVYYPEGTDKSLMLLEKLRATLSRTQWVHFLKVLNMFGLGICTRVELVRMLEDIVLPNGPRDLAMAELFDKFKSSLGYDDSEEKYNITQFQEPNFYNFLHSSEVSNCPTPTPSYRLLPAELLLPHCTGRTELCDRVLNDTCISIPTGSEDFSFKSTRKNIYEENLFKVEDERFELDLCIENNAAAIRVLEPFVEKCIALHKSLDSENITQFSHELKLSENLDILHIRAIARIYGDSGPEVIEALRSNPIIAAPVILDRLRQKEDEWKRVRSELKTTWRKITEANYQRSLDHRSFIFKQEDRKRRSPKALVNELKEVHHQIFNIGKGINLDNDDAFNSLEIKSQMIVGMDKIVEESVMLRQIRQGHPPKTLYTYCMSFKFEDDQIHTQIYDILTKEAKLLNSSNKQLFNIQLFLSGFIFHIFRVPLSADRRQAQIELAKVVTIEEQQRLVHEAELAGKAAIEPQTNQESEQEEDEQEPPLKKQKTNKGKKNSKNNRKRGMPIRRRDEESDDDDEPDVARDSKMQCEDTKAQMEEDLTIEKVTLRIQDTLSRKLNASQSKFAHLSSPSLNEWRLEDKLNPVRAHPRPSTLFFGSTAYYVFFRLYQFLYERLAAVRNLAKQMGKRPQQKKKHQTADERLHRYESMLWDLLENRIEPLKYEDECRSLLGASSYVLFTIDKLIEQLKKQTDALVNSSTSLQILSLYQFELARKLEVQQTDNKKFLNETEQLRRSAQLCRAYHLDIISQLDDSNLIQLEYFEDTQELGLGLVSSDGSLVKLFPELHEKDNEFVEHCEQFSRHDGQNRSTNSIRSKDKKEKSPYLRRNIRSFVTKINTVHSSTLEKLSTKVLKNTHHFYSLFCKLDLKTYKVNYQPLTFDAFVRRPLEFVPKYIIRLILNNSNVTIIPTIPADRPLSEQNRREIQFDAWLSKSFYAIHQQSAENDSNIRINNNNSNIINVQGQMDISNNNNHSSAEYEVSNSDDESVDQNDRYRSAAYLLGNWKTDDNDDDDVHSQGSSGQQRHENLQPKENLNDVLQAANDQQNQDGDTNMTL